LTDIEIQVWRGDLFNDKGKKGPPSQGNKLRTYRLVKTDYNLEKYLSEVKNFEHRKALTKLRINNHDLEIEKGRYSRKYKAPEERKCPHCPHSVEDERHFLLYCALYSTLREKLLKDMEKINKECFSLLDDDELFLLLMNPPQILAATIAKYIYDCFAKRSQAITY